MNQKKLSLVYIALISLQLAHVTFAQGTEGDQQDGTDRKGGHLDKHKEGDQNPNHWSDSKFIYRCAYGSTITSVLPNFQSGSSDDVMDLFVKHVTCSKVKKGVADIPVKCNWYPTICPDSTVYIEGVRKVVNDSTPHFEWACCVNQLACNTQCQQKTATLTSEDKVFLFPEKQTDSDQHAPSITMMMFHDVGGVATLDWKFCSSTDICYTPPPAPPGGSPAGGCDLGCLGLLGLLGLLALGSPTSSSAPGASSSAPAASTAAG